MTTDLQAVVASEMPLPFGVRAGSGSSLPGLNPNALQSIGVDPQIGFIDLDIDILAVITHRYTARRLARDRLDDAICNVHWRQSHHTI